MIEMKRFTTLYVKHVCMKCRDSRYRPEWDETPQNCHCDSLIEHTCHASQCQKRLAFKNAYFCGNPTCGCNNEYVCTLECHIDMEAEQGLNPNE